MRLLVDHAEIQNIGARTPQTQTTSNIPASTVSDSPFFPDPSSYSTTSTTPSSSDSNATAVKSIIEYLFLIIALLLASIIIFRRVIGLKRREHPMRPLYDNDFDPEPGVHLRTRSFPRTTGLPPPNANAPYPLLDDALGGLPAAYLGHHDRRNIRGYDVDLAGRRFRPANAELDHDGPLGDKDTLPAYEYSGGPPKYAELELQRILVTGNTVSPHPQNPTTITTTTTTAPTSTESDNSGEGAQTASENVAPQSPMAVPTNPEHPTPHSTPHPTPP